MLQFHGPGEKKRPEQKFWQPWGEIKSWGGGGIRPPPQKNVWNKRCKSTQLHDAFIGHARQRHDYASH